MISVSALVMYVAVVLATAGLTIWLLLSHFAPVRSNAGQRSFAFVYGLVAALPLAWFGLTAWLVARGYSRVGEWPHGFEIRSGKSVWIECVEANLDPAVFTLHHALVTTLGIAVGYSWIVFLPLHAVASASSTNRIRPWLAAYMIGMASFVLLMGFELGGVAEWLDG